MRKRLSTLLLICIMAVSAALYSGCSAGPANTEQIDTTRTQLFVYTYDGGYGSEWLYAAKQRFEELHKDNVLEEGKKGVQVYVTAQKVGVSQLLNQVLDDRHEIYFSEYADYYSYYSLGILGDITEAVTETLNEYGETRSIKDKLTTEQQEFYSITADDGSEHYYAVPHYSGYSGLTYNKDLFDTKLYYFAANRGTALEDQFIASPGDTKSYGPDGRTGVDETTGIDYSEDDGLPATYEEFFTLCEWIAKNGDIPVNWNGYDYNNYLGHLLDALIADYEGLDQMKLQFTLNGVATDLGTINSNGQFVEDAEDLPINASNGYELGRQAGRYYALEFLQKLITTDNFHNERAFNSGYSQINAQEDFLYGGEDGETTPVAMLLDGIWWMSEATTTFNTMVDGMGQQYSKMNRDFRFMPLPNASAEKTAEKAAGRKNLLYDHQRSICFMKANVPEFKRELALDFIKFINSDESLVEFTQIVNAPKALNYTMTDSQMEGMTEFGKSIIRMRSISDVLYPYSGNDEYLSRSSAITVSGSQMKDGTSYSYPGRVFHENTVSVKDYFEGIRYSMQSKW